MFSSNSFNVCPHCGKANSLNARYCSSCGKQLATPQQVVVCHRCHKTNSPLASFCGACGAPLRLGAKTKICPKCHREIDVNANVCSCGYDFTPIQYTAPAVPVPAAETVVQTNHGYAAQQSVAKPLNNHKHARLIAIISLIVLLVFAYLVVAPYVIDGKESGLRFDAEFDKGILYVDFGMDLVQPLYGVDLIKYVVDTFTNADLLETLGTTPLEYLFDTLGIGGIAILAMILVLAICLTVEIILSIIRIFIGKRAKHANYFHLVMAILSTLWILVAFFIGMFVESSSEESVWQTIRSFLVPTEFEIGYVALLIPIVFWFMAIMSMCCKAKKVQENIA